jgi:hypothetical protein
MGMAYHEPLKSISNMAAFLFSVIDDTPVTFVSHSYTYTHFGIYPLFPWLFGAVGIGDMKVHVLTRLLQHIPGRLLGGFRRNETNQRDHGSRIMKVRKARN